MNRTLVVLLSISCFAATETTLEEPTYVSILHEGMACDDLANSIQRLRTLTGRYEKLQHFL